MIDHIFLFSLFMEIRFVTQTCSKYNSGQVYTIASDYYMNIITTGVLILVYLENHQSW